MMRAHEIAAKAADLVGGERDRQHGAKKPNFDNIAALWSAYLDVRREPSWPLDAADVGHMMVLMKVARTQSGALNIDDYVDAAGYAACAGEVAGVLADDESEFCSKDVWNAGDDVAPPAPTFNVGDRVELRTSETPAKSGKIISGPDSNGFVFVAWPNVGSGALRDWYSVDYLKQVVS